MKKSVAARGMAFLMAFMMVLALMPPVTGRAEMRDTSRNVCIISKSVPKGKSGRRMNLTFVVENFYDDGITWEDVEVGIVNNGTILQALILVMPSMYFLLK